MTDDFDPANQTPKIDLNKDFDASVLRGKSALVTGGANGFGSLICRRLCAEGARVTIVDRQVEAGQQLAQELRKEGHQAVFVETDVTSWSSQINAFKTAISNSASGDSVDLVIPCAGTGGLPIQIPERASLDDDPPAPPTLTFDVTLIGVYYTALLALNYFRIPVPGGATKSQKKHIIFIGSLAGYLELPPLSDYTACKFGVRGLWKSLRQEVREMGFRTNLVAPTFLPTQNISSVSTALEREGAKIGNLDDAVAGVLRLACVEEIDGRAIAIGAHGNFDLRDDPEGSDGGIELLKYYKTGAFGHGMHDFKHVFEGR